MNTPASLLEDMQQRVSQLLRASPAAADVERQVRAVMAQGFQKLELVTREEFDIQRDLLANAQARIQALETRIAALEAKR